MSDTDIRQRIPRELERRVLWLATWTMHNGNHIRDG